MHFEKYYELVNAKGKHAKGKEELKHKIEQEQRLKSGLQQNGLIYLFLFSMRSSFIKCV